MEISFSKKREHLKLDEVAYECSVCGKWFNWDCNSSWYGSDKIEEEYPEQIKYFCSEECKDLKI